MTTVSTHPDWMRWPLPCPMLGHVTVVAPDRERSAVSHGITLIEPVMYHQIAERRFAVEGTPADCVITALMRIMPRPPSLVVSGVNRGLNIGHDILYSGTVAAATEAAMQGIPAIAVSAHFDYKSAAEVSAQLAARVLAEGLPPDVLLNVNHPRNWNGECRLTRQGRRSPEPTDRLRGAEAGLRFDLSAADQSQLSGGYGGLDRGIKHKNGRIPPRFLAATATENAERKPATVS